MRKSGEAVPAKTDRGRESDATSSDSQPLGGGEVPILYVAIEATKWVWNESSSRGYSRLVLLAIAAHCNSDGWAWPSLKTLEEAANTTRPTILQALEQLEQSSEIVIERGGEGPGSVNRYYLFRFMERVKKGKDEWYKRVKGVDLTSGKQVEWLESVKEEIHSKSENQNKNLLEQVEEVKNLPLLNEEKDWKKIREENERLELAKQERRDRKANRAAGNFQRPIVRPSNIPAKIVTHKQPESWIWFSTTFKRLAEVNAFSHADLWPMVDEMLSEIGREEAEQRLAIFIDGSEKVTGYLAKDFLAGGWRTIDPEEYQMPRIRNEE
jgi:Helix-turn-helix domain